MDRRLAASRSGSSPFRFVAPHCRLDWTAIHAVDATQVIRTTDVDALESVLEMVAYGSLHRQKHGDATVQSLKRLFEVSQLTVQYLLYVQNRLAADVQSTKTELEAARSEAASLRATTAQLRRDIEASERETRHVRRMLRVTLAQAERAAPQSTASSPAPSMTAAAAAAAAAASLDGGAPQQRKSTPHMSPTVNATAEPSPTTTTVTTHASPGPPPSPPRPWTSRSSTEAAERLRRVEEAVEELLMRSRAPVSASPIAGTRSGGGIEGASSPAAPLASPALYTVHGFHHPCEGVEQQPSPSPPLAPSSPRPGPPLPSPAAVPVIAADPSTSSLGPPGSFVAEQRLQFIRELPFELHGHERPGVRSRFPHSAEALRAVRAELAVELEAEVTSELQAQGIDPSACSGLTPAQFLGCMEALRARHQEATAAMTPQDRARENYMRNTVMWHVDQSAARALGKPGAPTTAMMAPVPSPPPPPFQQQQPSPATAALSSGHQYHPYPSPTAASCTAVSSTPPPPAALPLQPGIEPVQLALRDFQGPATTSFYSPLRLGSPSVTPPFPL